MKKRLDYIDIMKAITIIMAICGHINYPGISPVLKRYLYAFHMPVFFVCSGLTLNYLISYANTSIMQIIVK